MDVAVAGDEAIRDRFCHAGAIAEAPHPFQQHLAKGFLTHQHRPLVVS